MIELLTLGRQHGYPRLKDAIERALGIGCSDAAIVRYLMTANELERSCLPIDVPALARYDRPLPLMDNYDRLLGAEVQP
jgi:hypothetical protein